MDVESSVSEQGAWAVPCKKRYDLDEMLARMNAGNPHPEQDTGPARGREKW